jgi:adenylate cyclase
MLSIIIFFSRHSMIKAFSLPVHLSPGPYALNSAIMGILFGTGVGFLDYYLDKQVFRNKPLALIFVSKFIISILILWACFQFRRYVLFDLIVAPTIDNRDKMDSEVIWNDLLYMILIFAGVMSLVLNFMHEVNKKFGPGILLPLLLGKYRHPKEEERIFMFMDLKSSTTIAEQLGHFKYSAFIRDAFIDINHILSTYDAQVYQYVGDEIVVCWKTEEGLKNLASVHFFFACEKEFTKRTDYYQQHYGMLPQFKASLHLGKVTVVEIGEIKRDIAYHGDTINTAARIQSMCNEYKKKLLVSDLFCEMSKLSTQFKTQAHGNIMLKGKTIPVGILSVEE